MEIPKPNYRRTKPPLHIPAALDKEVRERDKNLCRICGKHTTDPLHHIWSGGMGRRRVHTLWNLAVVCATCHYEVHNGKRSEELQQQLKDWSESIYGV